MQKKRRDHIKEGEQAYQAWRDALLTKLEAREIYREGLLRRNCGYSL
jgi:hypothetical protein